MNVELTFEFPVIVGGCEARLTIWSRICLRIPNQPCHVTPERYQQVKSAFRFALEFPFAEREAFLRHFCADDLALLGQVLELLASDAIPQTCLDKPAVGTQFRIRAMSLSYTALRH